MSGRGKIDTLDYFRKNLTQPDRNLPDEKDDSVKGGAGSSNLLALRRIVPRPHTHIPNMWEQSDTKAVKGAKLPLYKILVELKKLSSRLLLSGPAKSNSFSTRHTSDNSVKIFKRRF